MVAHPIPSQAALAAVESEAQSFFSDTHGCHGWDHAVRVRASCLQLGQEEGADATVLALAAVLHDIGRKFEDASPGCVCHAQKSAELAAPILARHGIPPETIDAVVDCIACHRFRGTKVPRSIEAKVLFDADKLDAIGAIGIGRAFLYCGEHGALLDGGTRGSACVPLESPGHATRREFIEKLSKLKDRMTTPSGARRARERHAFMEAFFKRLGAEAAGEL